MKVFIVTEGFQSTGYGHLTRCLALYQAFEERGIQPTFIANCDESGKKYLGKINLDIYNWLEKSDKFIEQINGSEIAIIDSYLASKEIYSWISECVEKAVYIDDFLRIEYPKGIIINGTIGAENLPYKRNPNQRYLLGIDYIPLRKEFWDIPDIKRNEKVQNVLITFGGQDIRNLTFTILDSLLESFTPFNYHVVLGGNNTIENLDKYNGDNVNFYSSLNAKQMLELMLKCDLAITTAGQTTYELVRVGLQTIAIGVADNQKYNLKGWIEKGFLKKEIWYNQINFSDELLNLLKEIHYSDKKGNNAYCDGQGARRIVDLLVDSNNLILREVEKSDAELLFKWANDPASRQNAINTGSIKWEDHVMWFSQKLNSETTKIYIAIDHDKIPCGQIRFDRSNDSGIIDFYIASNFRGKNLGKELLLEGSQKIFNWWQDIKYVEGKVKKQNISSQKSFIKAGFEESDSNDYLVYIKSRLDKYENN